MKRVTKTDTQRLKVLEKKRATLLKANKHIRAARLILQGKTVGRLPKAKEVSKTLQRSAYVIQNSSVGVSAHIRALKYPGQAYGDGWAGNDK